MSKSFLSAFFFVFLLSLSSSAQAMDISVQISPVAVAPAEVSAFGINAGWERFKQSSIT